MYSVDFFADKNNKVNSMPVLRVKTSKELGLNNSF